MGHQPYVFPAYGTGSRPCLGASDFYTDHRRSFSGHDERLSVRIPRERDQLWDVVHRIQRLQAYRRRNDVDAALDAYMGFCPDNEYN